MDTKSRDELFPAFVLHRRDYGNSSLLLEIFSRPHGRFPVIAKGAKRPRNAGAALLQPFSPLLMNIVGRGEVKNLKQVEAADRPIPITGAGLYCGFYLNELIVRLLGRNDAHEELYDHYAAALVSLSGDADQAAALRRFELQLLEETGYAMVLDRDAERGEPLKPDARYDYDPERGPVECLSGSGVAVSGATLLALGAGAALDAQQTREAKELMRRVLARYLGDKPLKSREMFKKLFVKSS